MSTRAGRLLQRAVSTKRCKAFAAAIAIDPGCAEAHHRASLIRLRFGDFRRGWRDYEWRWQTKRAEQRRDVGAPLWRGEQPLQGKTILLVAEQGFGDTINFVRYATLVAARGATVMLDVPPAAQGDRRQRSRRGVGHRRRRAGARMSTIIVLCSACRSPLRPSSRRYLRTFPISGRSAAPRQMA